ncbi:hypothetical protein AB6D66_19025 [Vibrio pomeroyi]|uniref:Uncharacterized protein n=1 Tax=Vibrio pomeroyi TaxID=198832 RepID=A0ABV4N1H5_9VIBR
MFKKTLLATSALLISSTAFAADVENSNLDIAFQGAHFQGAGNQVTMLRVPVTNKDTGQTQFFDMSAQFAADKNGNLVFKNMSSVKSVAFASTNQIRAGHYLDEDGKSWYVDGPSTAPDGRLVWSLSCSNRCFGNGSASLQVMSGPAKSNGLISQMDAYKVIIKSPTSLNYGLLNGDYVATAGQAGNMITVVRYDSSAEPSSSWALRSAPEPQPED